MSRDLFDTLPPGLARGAATRGLGGEPRNGDFASLLEAASRPSAHRMVVDPTLAAMATPDTIGPAAAWRTPAPPAAPMVTGEWGNSAARSTDPSATAAALAPESTPVVGHPPWGPPGMAEGHSRSPLRSVGMDARRTWAERPLRDKLVPIAFAIAGIWMLVAIVSSILQSPGEGLGGLLLLAAVVFIVLRGLKRSRSRPPSTS
jgi:hypothetical protein